MFSIFRYEPYYDFDRFFDEFLSPRTQRSLSEVQQRVTESSSGAVRAFKPRMDLHEDKEKNLVTAFEFPGVPKEYIQIDVHNGKLTVSAETKRSSEQAENGYAVCERRYGKYSRTLQLPQGIKVEMQDEEIKASMDSGVLTVTFSKSTPELIPKRIAVA